MATLTEAQRRRVNQQNAARSTGPRSAEGRAASSRNALKHGLCAAPHPLPNEDPHEARDEGLRWTEHYRPRTEHHLELVGRIAGACLVQRRCRRAADATIARQVLNAEADLDLAHEAEVDELTARLRKEPAAAVSGLRRSALGCRWLIGRWTRLRDQLDGLGGLGGPDADELIRLHGHRVFATAQTLPDPVAHELRLHCVMSCPGVQPEALEALLWRLPEGLKPAYRGRWGEPAANRAELRRQIDEALAELSGREQRLRTGREAVERATAADQALVIADPERARLWLRYYGESNSAFFRASRELQRSLEEDEGGGAPDDAARPRNEPNDPVDPPLVDERERACEASAAVPSGPGAGPGAPDLGGSPMAAGGVPAAAAAGRSRNEPDGAPQGNLTEAEVDAYALQVLIASSPLAAAIWERSLRLRQRIDDPAERERLIREQERDLATWNAEIRRLEELAD